ncbi:ribonuclease H-like domain-containing protein [Tanacetum coccineum]
MNIFGGERRCLLWTDLGIHKHVTRGCPWVLLGDFNVALNLEDTYSGSSSLNSAMIEFKDCVADIENKILGGVAAHTVQLMCLLIVCFKLLLSLKRFKASIEEVVHDQDSSVRGGSGATFQDFFNEAKWIFKESMFSIGDDRASGPDGFTFAFFKKGWDIVGHDVCKSIRNFFVNGQLLKELNHTFIALIPKVDIQKAYDTVDWNFLETILKRFGFHTVMIKWIMACVSSSSYYICVNGDVHGFFKGKRGLRQGDPLSPYLFTLVMEVLTLILRRQVRNSNFFRYHKHCEEIQLINVFFADDLFLFARGDVNSAKIILDSLTELHAGDGLKHGSLKPHPLDDFNPVLEVNKLDTCWWRDNNGHMSKFSVKAAWEAFRPRGNEVTWHRIVWNLVGGGMDIVPARLEDIVDFLQPTASHQR